jgi:hypothetical protein
MTWHLLSSLQTTFDVNDALTTEYMIVGQALTNAHILSLVGDGASASNWCGRHVDTDAQIRSA